jgi:autotransporter-associated beta strand protein
MIKGSGDWVVTNNPAYVYFDGGILKARTANKELFGTGDNRPTRVTVGPRGAIFDTAGKNVSISAPIEATGAGGVTALALTNGPLANYHAAPLVVIRGDGTGATAVAEYDSATMSVTGVKITSPGQGYTAANTTAYIDWGGYRNKDPVPLAVTVGNPTGGGLVKRGAGTLTLKAANTFAGDVTVEGGTLKLAAEGAIPAGARVVANGGAVAGASGVTGPSTIEIGIDPATLVRGQKYVLARYPAGAPATLPSIVWTGGEAPAHWEVQMRGTDLVLAFVRGITLSFR